MTMIIYIGSFLMLLASAGEEDPTDHIFGINGCEATPIPRVQVEEPVSEFFYSFQIDNIPRFQHNKEKGTVKLPMNELLQGWYYHTASVFDLLDAGVVEWYFFPNPSSLFTHANWGTAENLMTVMNEGTLNDAIKRDRKRMDQHEDSHEDGDYVWENADRLRRFKVNTHAAMTSAQKQFAALSFDQVQTTQVIAYPEPVPDFTPLQNALKDALEDVEFPLSPGGHTDLKVSTNCLHGESPDYTDEYLVIELDKELVYHKGQTLFPLKLWTNVAGRSYWKVNEAKGTLELYFRGFQMGYLDAREPVKQLKYFQSPPHMSKDNRVNEVTEWKKPFCNLPEKIRKMEEDVHMFWQPMDVVCPEEKLKKFEKLILKADFTTLVETSDPIKEVKLISAATDYVMCAGGYMRSYIKYSHGYDFLEAGAFIHFLLEFHAPFVIPFLTHEDLNQFKVDYIYGKEAPPSLTGFGMGTSGTNQGDAPLHTIDQEYHLKESNTDTVWSKEESMSRKERREKGGETAVGGGETCSEANCNSAQRCGCMNSPFNWCWCTERTEEDVGSWAEEDVGSMAEEDVGSWAEEDVGSWAEEDVGSWAEEDVGSWAEAENAVGPPFADAAAQAKDTVMMVESDQGSYIVNGFALVGLVSLVYGAYAHYFGKKAGDHTRLQMA